MKFKLAGVFLASFVLFGCATSRSNLSVAPPSSHSPNAINGVVVDISSVLDKRKFIDNPSSPSTPSLGFGGIANADERILSRAVGRKRNGYGKALGDVMLSDDQSIQGLIKDTCAAALTQYGFTVGDDRSDLTGAKHVYVDVNEFWTYIDVKFTSLTLITRINIVLILEQGRSAEVLAVETHSYQIVTEADWTKNMKLALDALVKNSKDPLERLLLQ